MFRYVLSFLNALTLRTLKDPVYIPVCRLLLVLLQVGGIIVDVNLSEHSATIRFSEYHDGAAPFLIINHTKDQTLQFHQRWENKTWARGKTNKRSWATSWSTQVYVTILMKPNDYWVGCICKWVQTGEEKGQKLDIKHEGVKQIMVVIMSSSM